ncbi:LOW QUALITY PROTEIN: uncharacterized protein LINC03040 [Camelus dromedarius]|uniref:LOW QUALITY PROTEIN: uncharacterized protein LINC03040 n=1 Tax=Camelus dromedarius TaxID=9838 RepID=UPI0031197701
MMPLTEAGALAPGGGPAGTELVRKEGVNGGVLSSQDPEAQADDLAIPTLLKARVSRRPGETSAVLKDRKRGCFSHGEQHTHTKAGQWGLVCCTSLENGGGGGRRLRLLWQESIVGGLCRPLRPHPGFRESDSAESATLHLLQYTRSLRRNYRIAGARLMRSNYPPPLSSAALSSSRTTP